MRRTVFGIALGGLALVQVGVIPVLFPVLAVPNVLLTVLVWMLFNTRLSRTLIAAALTGFGVDLFSPLPFGVAVTSLTAVILILSGLRQVITPHTRVIFVLGASVVVGYVIYQALLFGLAWIMIHPRDGDVWVWDRFLGLGQLGSIAVMLLCLLPLQWLKRTSFFSFDEQKSFQKKF